MSVTSPGVPVGWREKAHQIMDKDDPRYVEKFVALVRAAEEDEFRDVPDERLRAAVEAALAEHPSAIGLRFAAGAGNRLNKHRIPETGGAVAELPVPAGECATTAVAREAVV